MAQQKTFFIKEPCAIVRGEPDPMDNLKNVSQDG